MRVGAESPEHRSYACQKQEGEKHPGLQSSAIHPQLSPY
jgi:hypothetical protein